MRIEEWIMDLIPGVVCANGYIFAPPVEHIFSGFYYEAARSAYHVGEFMMPLYVEPVMMRSLGYCRRLPKMDGWINRETKGKGLAHDIASRIEKYRTEAKMKIGIADFIVNLDEIQFETGHSYIISKWMSYSKVMLGQYEEARILFAKLILNAPQEKNTDHEDILEMIRKLPVFGDSVRKILLDIEKISKENLGISC